MVGRHDHHGIDADAVVGPDQILCVGRASADAGEDARVRGECVDARFGDVDPFPLRERVIFADVCGREERSRTLAVVVSCVLRQFLVLDLKVRAEGGQ